MLLTRWHQEFTCTFRSRRHQQRCLYFEKSVLFHCCANGTVDLCANAKVLLHTLTTNIEIAILQTNRFINIIGALIYREWWWLRGVQDFDDTLSHFHLARRQCCVDSAFRTSANDTRDAHDVFTANINIVVDHALDDSGVVTKVYECQLFTVLTTATDPATHRNGGADVRFIQLAAHMCAHCGRFHCVFLRGLRSPTMDARWVTNSAWTTML
ncbi:unannotated protein [freshwater metagenome]|uniref:Unannotated protein n=1 Tax=freshwater metagenome TaxID=449393 RepID=A0A6J6HBI1_9ZZZZ